MNIEIDYSLFGFREDYDPKNKIVKQEDIIFEDKIYFISTVDLGLDHSFDGGKPLYYETMIFLKGTYSDLYCNRYETREEALIEHNKLIELFNNKKMMLKDNWFEIKGEDK